MGMDHEKTKIQHINLNQNSAPVGFGVVIFCKRNPQTDENARTICNQLNYDQSFINLYS